MNIAIAGYGLEGKSNYEYFKSRGAITIVDEQDNISDLPSNVPTILGTGAFQKLSGFDLVVRTAGVAPRKIKTDGKIWSATNEFFAKCRTPIIGITGTKGKGTTASMVASMLQASDHKTVLVGNIGVPALDVLDEANQADAVVYELSSFQLWDLEKSPEVAVILMIEPDHLDIHTDFNEYIAAKANIRKYQLETDICFYHPTNQYSRQIALSSGLPNAHRYNDPSDPDSVCVQGDWLTIDGCQMLSTEVVQLPGAHNLENACAAISAVREFTDDWKAIEEGLRSFHGLDHRLKLVREVGGVSYYDDSIATTPGSVVAAIKSFDQPKVLILGGSSKGVPDFSPIAKAAGQDNVRAAILIGDEADTIEKALSNSGVNLVNLGKETTMTEIVTAARQQAHSGDVVILSPACASFGMFKGYVDRGNQFIAAVNELK